MTTPAAQRLNMVESQIRPSDVTDRRILRAFAEVEREHFVPAECASIAYMDEAVPLLPAAKGRAARFLMPPRSFAKLVQLADVETTDAVLVVGAGRGFSSAILAKMAGSVIALETDETLAAAAKSNLQGVANVAVAASGNLTTGPAGPEQFDVIVVEGSLYSAPEGLLNRLKDGGRLVAILIQDGVGRATQWTRTASTFAESQTFEASAATLPGFERSPAFVF